MKKPFHAPKFGEILQPNAMPIFNYNSFGRNINNSQKLDEDQNSDHNRSIHTLLYQGNTNEEQKEKNAADLGTGTKCDVCHNDMAQKMCQLCKENKYFCNDCFEFIHKKNQLSHIPSQISNENLNIKADSLFKSYE